MTVEGVGLDQLVMCRQTARCGVTLNAGESKTYKQCKLSKRFQLMQNFGMTYCIRMTRIEHGHTVVKEIRL
jgi:hypothetical protein